MRSWREKDCEQTSIGFGRTSPHPLLTTIYSLSCADILLRDVRLIILLTTLSDSMALWQKNHRTQVIGRRFHSTLDPVILQPHNLRMDAVRNLK